MKKFDIYLSGVGGQGIGLISEILLRAVDHAGLNSCGVDTHGLAQRGGVVASQLRIGENIFSPVVRKGRVDLVIALERHEALRAAAPYLKKGGILVYYNAVWQPLSVRLGSSEETSEEAVEEFCKKNDIKVFNVHIPNLEDARMQNIALLSCIEKHQLIPGVKKEHYLAAMNDLMTGNMLSKNLELFELQTGK